MCWQSSSTQRKKKFSEVGWIEFLSPLVGGNTLSRCIWFKKPRSSLILQARTHMKYFPVLFFLIIPIYVHFLFPFIASSSRRWICKCRIESRVLRWMERGWGAGACWQHIACQLLPVRVPPPACLPKVCHHHHHYPTQSHNHLRCPIYLPSALLLPHHRHAR